MAEGAWLWPPTWQGCASCPPPHPLGRIEGGMVVLGTRDCRAVQRSGPACETGHLGQSCSCWFSVAPEASPPRAWFPSSLFTFSACLSHVIK